MEYSPQVLATLRGLRDNPSDPALQRSAGNAYWSCIEKNLFDCVREKKDIRGFLDREFDCVNFGVSAEVLENASTIPGRHLRISLVSDWLVETHTKIVSADRLDALEKEKKASTLQIQRIEQDIKNLQQLRRDQIAQSLAGKIPNDKCEKTLELLDHADDLYRSSARIKKMSSRGVFIPAADKRRHCEMEREHAACVDQIGRFTASVESADAAASIKRISGQIEEGIVRVLEIEESICRTENAMKEVAQKRQALSAAEIEAALRKEIDYLKELMMLAAKRLHRENCCFIKSDDVFFTVKEADDCIERILEFDPEILHNQRAAVFGLPGIALVPGCGSALYDWKNNRIVVPHIVPGGNFMASIASGMIEYRLDADEDKRLLTSYNKLPRHKDVKSVFHLKNELVKDYIAWMTSEYKGYKILPKEERKWFEQEIAPNKNEIAVPLEYRSFMLNGDAFAAKCREIESVLAQGTDACPPEALWTAGILFYQQGRFNKAFEALSALIRREPERPMAYYNLGHTCGKLMRKQDAIQYFGEFCKRNPQSWWASAAMEHLRRLQTGHAN
jgi:tetratricopeptide (TPR) repeat protein